MTSVSTSARLERRVADLANRDPQFAAAYPSAAVTAAAGAPGLRLLQIIQTVIQGYAERSALGNGLPTS